MREVVEELSETDIRRLRRVLLCNLLVKYSLVPQDWENPKDDTKYHTARGEYELIGQILVLAPPNVDGGAEQLNLKRKKLLTLLMTACEQKSADQLMNLYRSLAECCDLDAHELIPSRLSRNTSSLRSQCAFFISPMLSKSTQKDHGHSVEHLAIVNRYNNNEGDVQTILSDTLEPIKSLRPIEPETNYYRAAHITKSWDNVADVAVQCMRTFRYEASIEQKKAILLAIAILVYQVDIANKLHEAGATFDALPDSIKVPCKNFVSNFLKRRGNTDVPDSELDAYDYFLKNLLSRLEEEEIEAKDTSGKRKCCIVM